MKTDPDQRPACFGDVQTVFPMAEDGLRRSPSTCLACRHKTECLRSAMVKTDEGLAIREACLDRAYASGMVGFLERWARKKDLFHQRRQPKKRVNKECPAGRKA